MNERHIISFHWEDYNPVLLCYDYGTSSIEQLHLDIINFSLSSHKICVGRMDGERYIPCPNKTKLSKNSNCNRCSPPGIPVLECVFEPRCNGERCGSPPFCTRPHVVYLALYGNLIKVGMTSEKRFSERIIEQGADAAAPVFKCSNRLEARKLEREISGRFKIPQEIKPVKLMRQWVTSPSAAQMRNVYQTYLDKINRWNQTLNNNLNIFDGYPINSRPLSPPKIKHSAGVHTGTFMGIKGRYLLYSTQKGAVAVDVSDMVGREIVTNIVNDSR